MSPTRPIDFVLPKLKNTKKTGTGWTARCPYHEDHHNSLSISEGNDGRALLYCHAGCHFDNVVHALGLKQKDLFREDQQTKSAHRAPGTYKKTIIVKTYDYTDENSNLLFQVCRTAKKEFPSRRPDGSGGWLWGLDGLVPVLYRLPQLVFAVKEGETVFVVEGEKDADRLHNEGLIATTNPMGSGKWRDSYNRHFKGANVIILPDNDEPGRKHAQSVAESLYGIAQTVKIVQLPELPEKGDVSDWFEQGGTLAKLQELLKEMPYWFPAKDAQSKNQDLLPSVTYNLTDYGNAERLVATYGLDLRFCVAWKAWMFWDGLRWHLDTTGQLQRLAKHVVRNIHNEAAQERDEKARHEITKHAFRSEANARIRGMLELAWSEQGIPIEPLRFDVNPWLLNVKNGCIDLHTGQLQPHQRENLLTKLVPVIFDANAPCPLWLRFLHDVMGGNQEMIDFLQRAVGYTFTGVLHEHALFFLYGTGRNGKTTFLEIIYALLGDYAEKAEFSSFLVRKHDNNVRNDLARLRGARFVSAAETKEGSRLDVSVVKQLTGGDTITTRFLYGEFFSFRPTFKLWMAANHKPDIKDTTDATWERVKLIPFTVKFNQPDLLLLDKLLDELPGILAWAVRGCLAWQRHGLHAPPTVIAATDDYRREMDPLSGFLSEMCVFDPSCETPASALYDTYKKWCKSKEIQTISQQAFGRILREKGFVNTKATSGEFRDRVIWRRIRLN